MKSSTDGGVEGLAHSWCSGSSQRSECKASNLVNHVFTELTLCTCALLIWNMFGPLGSTKVEMLEHTRIFDILVYFQLQQHFQAGSVMDVMIKHPQTTIYNSRLKLSTNTMQGTLPKRSQGIHCWLLLDKLPVADSSLRCCFFQSNQDYFEGSTHWIPPSKKMLYCHICVCIYGKIFAPKYRSVGWV